VSLSKVPIICGVGHETDFTLCDFAADLRAPTPTAAAELATQTTMNELQENLKTFDFQLTTSMQDILEEQSNALASLRDGLRFFSPSRRIQSERQRLDDVAHRFGVAHIHRLALEANQIEGFGKRLDALNPLQVLERGYAVVTRQADGKVINKTKQVKSKDEIRVRVSDGSFDATVK
ncbi:MAG TPA: exodeoxyribonuclease VII large subunit, partial [Anaerolineales bacterium]